MALSEPLGGGMFVSNVVLAAVVLTGSNGRQVRYQLPFVFAMAFVTCAVLCWQRRCWRVRMTARQGVTQSVILIVPAMAHPLMVFKGVCGALLQPAE